MLTRHIIVCTLLMLQFAIAQYNIPSPPAPAPYPTNNIPSTNNMPQGPDMPQLTGLEVSCGDAQFRVRVTFSGKFNGIIFAKGFFSNSECVYVRPGTNANSYDFIVGYNQCGSNAGTAVSSGGPAGGFPSSPAANPYSGGNTGVSSSSSQQGSIPRFFETTIIIQFDPNIQEKWDVSRVLRCEWYNSYEKVVTFRPFNVDIMDVVRASFVGDNIGAWMQIQQGKGPWAGEVNGIVRIGDILTMVIGIQDPKKEFDLFVKNCMANDGKSAPILLVDENGCIIRSKIMGPFQKNTNFGSSASVVAYSYFQAFKFPDTMEVHLQCTIQICRGGCQPMCASQSGNLGPAPGSTGTGSVPYPSLPLQNPSPVPNPYPAPYPAPIPDPNNPNNPGLPVPNPFPAPYPPVGTPRSLDGQYDVTNIATTTIKPVHHRRRRESGYDHYTQGLKKVIRVVSLNDLSFSLESNGTNTMILASKMDDGSSICMSTPGFAVGLVFLLALLVVACLITVVLCIRIKSQGISNGKTILAYDNPQYVKQ